MKYTVNALLKIQCLGTESAISGVSEKDTIAYFWSFGLKLSKPEPYHSRFHVFD